MEPHRIISAEYNVKKYLLIFGRPKILQYSIICVEVVVFFKKALPIS